MNINVMTNRIGRRALRLIIAGVLHTVCIVSLVLIMPAFCSHAAEEKGSVRSGWIYENGCYHYVDGEGNPVKGRLITPTEGHTYWLDEDGVLQYGVFYVEGRSFTSDASGWIRLKNGWLTFEGSWDEVKAGQDAGEKTAAGRGLIRENGIWYYIDNDGNYGNEVLIADDTSFTINEPSENEDKKKLNAAAASGMQMPYSKEEIKVFPDGLLQVYISGGETGFPGWVQSEGSWYFSDAEGAAVNDLIISDAAGRVFHIGKEGKPAGGFVNWDGEICRFEENGALCYKEGWIEDNSGRYYVNSNGAVARNEVFQVNGSIYYAGSDGKLTGGFHSIGGKRRYFEDNGSLRVEKGWIDYSGSRYYINDVSDIVTGGPVEIDGKYYYFENAGELKKGKIEADGLSFYYTDEDGAFLTDTDFTIDDITYHADPEGRVFVGTMYEKAQGYYSDTDYLITVNLATQRTAVFEGTKGNWRLLREMIVSTGARINPTPKGEYKTTVHTLHFNAYGVRAWYATGFIGGLYLFHSSPYEIDSEPRVCTDPRLGVPASHGCVRMALEDAKWMYDNLPLRTKVVIYEE